VASGNPTLVQLKIFIGYYIFVIAYVYANEVHFTEKNFTVSSNLISLLFAKGDKRGLSLICIWK